MRIRQASVFFPYVLFAALFGTPAPPASAQNQQPSGSPAAVPRIYEASKETVIRGNISEVVARAARGLPLGLHLMTATAQGTVDVHLGPYFARAAGEIGLVPGATIQVTGVNAHFEAGDVFLARLIIVGGQTITVRNENGIPLRPAPPGARVARPSGGQ